MKCFASVVMLWGLCVASTASAQTPVPRVLVDIGATVVGGGALGSTDAVYMTPSGAAYTLFSTSQSWSSGAGFVGHVQIRLSPRVQLEIGESWTRPTMESSITNDVEGAASTVATQTVHQFLTSAGVTVSMPQRGRFRPFGRATLSWLRQLSDDQTLFRSGLAGEFGGGGVYLLADVPGHFKAYGLRADVFVNVRSGGLELAQKSRVIAPGISASFIFKL